jgi:hypothetical protein
LSAVADIRERADDGWSCSATAATLAPESCSRATLAAARGPWSTSTCGCLRGERRAEVRHGGRAARTELALGLHRLDPHCASAWSSLAATQVRDRRA